MRFWLPLVSMVGFVFVNAVNVGMNGRRRCSGAQSSASRLFSVEHIAGVERLSVCQRHLKLRIINVVSIIVLEEAALYLQTKWLYMRPGDENRQ